MKQDFWTYNKPLSMTGLGGGAASLSVVSSGDPYDAAHSGFFSKSASPLDFDNSSYDEFSSSGTSGLSGNTHDAYGSAFFDNYSQKIFGNNNYTSAVDPWIWDWSNGGSSYTGNANFYAVSSNGSAFANLDNAKQFIAIGLTYCNIIPLGQTSFISFTTDNKAGTVLNPLMMPPIPKVSPIVCFNPYFAGISKSTTVEGS